MNTKQLSMILGVIVLILLAVLAYMVLGGNRQIDSLSQQNTIPESNLQENNTNTGQSVSTTPTKTEKTVVWKTHNFKGPTNFSIKYLPSWTPTETHIDPSITSAASLKLTNGSYAITIGQGDTESDHCIFSDTKGFSGEEAYYTDLRNFSFVEMQTPIGLLRRFPSSTIYAGTNIDRDFSFCGESGNTKGEFYSPLVVGYISYSLPSDYDLKILEEMDAIIKTINK